MPVDIHSRALVEHCACDGVRAYLSAEQLAAVTPWSFAAIAAMVKRGVLQRGVHYFQPQGQRSRLIFKWAAIVQFIEAGGGPSEAAPDHRAAARATKGPG